MSGFLFLFNNHLTNVADHRIQMKLDRIQISTNTTHLSVGIVRKQKSNIAPIRLQQLSCRYCFLKFKLSSTTEIRRPFTFNQVLFYPIRCSLHGQHHFPQCHDNILVNQTSRYNRLSYIQHILIKTHSSPVHRSVFLCVR